MTAHDRNSPAVIMVRRLKAHKLIPRNDFAVCARTPGDTRWSVVNTTTDLAYPVTGHATMTDTANSVEWEITEADGITFVEPKEGT